MTLKVFAFGSKLLMKRATFSPNLVKCLRSNPVLLKKLPTFVDYWRLSCLSLRLNFEFTPIQFGLKNNLFASIDMLLVLITIIWAMVVIYPHTRWISYIQAPYLLWVSFASILQITITFLNK